MLIISFVFLFCSGVAYAAEEGEIYQKEDGYWYRMIDGKEYQVVNGNEGGSLTDAIKSAKDSSILDEEDSKTVGRLGGNISSAAGNVTSFLIYVMFAFCFVTSAFDLLYISAPPLRPVLWNRSSGVAQTQNFGSSNGMQGQQYNNNQLGQSQQGEQSKKWCLVSDELKYVMNYQNNMPQKALIMSYFKKRAYAVIVIVVVVFLLIGSSVFTDFGLNIGEMLLSFVK